MIRPSAVSLLSAGALALILVGVADHRARAEHPLRELLRKAEAKEAENGFCKTANWPRESSQHYVRWLEGAIRGSARMEAFAGGACQFDEATDVFRRRGRKCVKYSWYACAPNKKCASGSDTDCKTASGSWERLKH